jgi:type I restriction enzyme S subunit
MAVKQGYKQTEVGVIPEDWEVKGFGEICKVNQGLQIAIEERLKVPTVQSKIYITIQYLNSGKTVEYIDDYTTTVCCTEDDVLMTRTGNTGMVVTGVSGVFHNNFFKINFDRKQVDRRFLVEYLKIDKIRHIILVKAGTSTIPDLNHSDFYSIPVILPPLYEQQAIAEALSDVDGLISALDALIAKQRAIKQGAMQELLTGQRRLPGFAGEWEQVYLGDLFTFKNGLNKSKEFFGFGTPIVNYMDVFENAVIFCSKLEGRVSLTTQEIKNFDVKKGDVLFTRTSETPDEVGMASVILDDPEQTVFSGFVLRGRPKDDRLCDAFKAYCFRSSSVRNQIISKASYTTRALTNGRILSAVVLSVPPPAEQTAIAQIFADMDDAIAALVQKRAKTVALKQGMMQALLTGQVRLV